MNDPKALRERMLRYLLPVCLTAVVVNINKFFEQTWRDPLQVTMNKGGQKFLYFILLHYFLILWLYRIMILVYLFTLKEKCRIARLIVENSESFPEEPLKAAKLSGDDCRDVCGNRITLNNINIS